MHLVIAIAAIAVILIIVMTRGSRSRSSTALPPSPPSQVAPASPSVREPVRNAEIADALSMYDRKWVMCSPTDTYFIENGQKRYVARDAELVFTEASCDVLSQIPDGPPL